MAGGCLKLQLELELAMKKTNVLVIFGSKSVEHEVSVVTGMQVLESIDREKYNPIPVYIDKQGRWWSGEEVGKLENFKDLELKSKKGLKQYILSPVWGAYELIPAKNKLFQKPIKFDIAFLAIHGTFGEDGTIQGMMEMAGVPYTGCGVTASAVGMDKVIQKNVFEKEGLPVVKYLWFRSCEWKENQKSIVNKIEKELGFPVFVKPANLGSSVGINMAKNKKQLEWAIDVAKEFDTKIIVEEGLEGIDEINCSVMGVDDYETSVCEQPVKNNKLLSYEDKYMKGGKTKGMVNLSRLVPAPIDEKLTKKIQDYSKIAFRSVNGSGVARIDYLVDIKKEKVFINEINTLPGSLAFYLWEKSGYPFTKLIDKIIELGFEYYQKRHKINFSYDSGLLKKFGKGVKN
jgi:D-alanine-D-alanine ligase